MKKLLLSLICLTLLSFSPLAQEAMVKDHAYVVSSINVDSSQQIISGQKYSLVPQVVIYDGTSEYVGSVSKFTGCYNGKRYEDGVYKTNCSMGVVDNLTSTSTTDSLSAKQGKVLNDKISNIYTKSEVDAKISGTGVSASDILNLVYPVGSIYMSASNVSPASFLGGEWQALDEGRVLIGANSTYTAGSKGGEVKNLHTHSVTAKGSISGTALTVAQLPAHSHSLNNHTHSIPSLSGSTNTTGEHTHTYTVRNQHSPSGTGSVWTYWERDATGTTSAAGNHSHTVTTNASTTGASSGSTGNTGSGNTHTHSFTGSAVTSGSTEVNNMQPCLAVYMWQRTK